MKDVHGNGIKPINKFHLCIHQRNPQPKKKKSLREIEQQKRESLRKEKGIEKTEILRRERELQRKREIA
jgi:hypothetical protein